VTLSWNTLEPIKGSGIIAGCDAAQEWMLPWWWEKYSESNTLPVTFFDFGLSAQARAFCKERGSLVDLFLPETFTPQQHQVPSSLQTLWKDTFEWNDDPFWWNKRMKCHYKPFALLMSPYEHTLWVDVDCEVCADLTSLLTTISSKDTIYMTPRTEATQKSYLEQGITLPEEVGYNSGVIGFHYRSELILRWAEKTLTEHPFFISDEDLFSRLAFLEKWDVEHLDQNFNWLPHFRGFHPEAKINHWVGNSGKFFLSLRMQKIL
jgi:hypothetical protein